MEENFDFGKLVLDGKAGENNIKSSNDSFYVNLELSEYWGAKIAKLDCDIPQYADENGKEDCICIPIKRNNIFVSKKNNYFSSFLATRNIYHNGIGTHSLLLVLPADIINLKNKLGFNRIYVGSMRPTSYNYKKKRRKK